jgi:hypothetical protein
MTENTMIRELTDDELLMVAGGQEMEREAVRYTASRIMDWGPFRFASLDSGVWAFMIGSVANGGVLWSGGPDIPTRVTTYGS